MKPICCFVSLLFVAIAAGPGLAQTRDGAMTTGEIKRRVAEAHAKDRRLIVLLKTGGSISGTVLPESDTRFGLRHSQLTLEGLSFLLHGEGMPSCSIGN